MAKKNEIKSLVVKKFSSIGEIERAIAKLGRRKEAFEAIKGLTYKDPKVSVAEVQFVDCILEIYGADSPEFKRHQYFTTWERALGLVNRLDSDFQRSFEKGLNHGCELINGLIQSLQEKRLDFDGTVSEGALPAEVSENGLIPSLKKKVFLVHGHDFQARSEVESLVRRLKLDPIILDDQANLGRTIIEKFEDVSGQAAFAIVIATGDDYGYPKSKGEGDRKLRARQNVIGEYFWFMAKLGRKNVALLYEAEVELPTDVHGFGYVSLGDSNWKFRLAKEMKNAGMVVDMNDL